MHQISRAIVRDCVTKGIELIAIGRTIGWKQETDMGAQQNRLFSQLGHATLIELIKYKADALGIAVITTEESYTSQASFVNDDPLDNCEEIQFTKTKART